MSYPQRTAVATSPRSSEVVRAYARWAPIYDLVFGTIMAPGRRLAAGSVPAGARDVLELGVGTGLSLPFYRDTCRVTGIDLSPDMLEGARELVAGRGLGHVVAIEEMDACALGFADSTFDAALAMYAVTCVPDPDAMLAEAVRVVRPGGRVIIVSRFASEGGVLAALGKALRPVGRWLGISARVTASSLVRAPGLRLVKARGVGIGGYYRLLEFEVVK